MLKTPNNDFQNILNKINAGNEQTPINEGNNTDPLEPSELNELLFHLKTIQNNSTTSTKTDIKTVFINHDKVHFTSSIDIDKATTNSIKNIINNSNKLNLNIKSILIEKEQTDIAPKHTIDHSNVDKNNTIAPKPLNTNELLNLKRLNENRINKSPTSLINAFKNNNTNISNQPTNKTHNNTGDKIPVSEIISESKDTNIVKNKSSILENNNTILNTKHTNQKAPEHNNQNDIKSTDSNSNVKNTDAQANIKNETLKQFSSDPVKNTLTKTLNANSLENTKSSLKKSTQVENVNIDKSNITKPIIEEPLNKVRTSSILNSYINKPIPATNNKTNNLPNTTNDTKAINNTDSVFLDNAPLVEDTIKTTKTHSSGSRFIQNHLDIPDNTFNEQIFENKNNSIDESISFKLKDLQNQRSFSEKLTSEIAKHVHKTEVKPETSEQVKIIIQPKSLGRIDIVLTNKGDKLNLSIKVSNKGVENLLTENIISLKEKIENNTTLNMNNINIYTESSKENQNNLLHKRVEENYSENENGSNGNGSNGGGDSRENPKKKEEPLNYEELQEEYLTNSFE